MKRATNGKRWRLWAVIVALLLAVSAAVGVLAVKGDWRYRLGNAFRLYPPICLRTVTPTDEWYARSLNALAQEEGVVFSDDLILVREGAPIPNDWSPALTEVNGSFMQLAAAEAFARLRDYVYTETETNILITSAYRSPEEQLTEYEKRGEEIAARPGESEHETGLALDVCVKWYGSMSFLKTRAGRLVNNECARFGFIIRYPQGKEMETGFAYEPWHLRYVGAPHAEIIMRHGLTLEAYFSMLSPDVWYRFGDYLVMRSAQENPLLPSDFSECRVSSADGAYRIFTVLCSNLV